MEDLDQGQTLRSFTPGTKVFGRYTLRRILGRGGMGVVWLARDEDLDRDVALKFLPEVVALDPASVAELKRETRRNLELTHPHIVRIYDFVQDARSAAISMEFVDGTSLSTLRLERPQSVFPLAEVERLFSQLADGLAYAHEKAKIVHRDLKPANLMVNGRGELKITDFGIATSIADSVSRVSGQGSSGTAVYMSPQQMMGEKPAVTDDIYALGATLFELLTGKPPFYTGNVILQVQNKVPPTIAARREELGVTNVDAVPPAWERAIAVCLAKEPSARPASVRALQAMLRGETPAQPAPAVAPVASAARAAETAATLASPAKPAAERPVQPRRLGPVIGIIGVALAAAAVFALVWFNASRTPDSNSQATPKSEVTKEPAVVAKKSDPVSEKVEVDPVQPVREEPKVAPEPVKPVPASLRLAVEPADAVIRVGGKTYPSPLHLQDIPAGPIELVVSRKGFRERRLQFDLAEGQSFEAPAVRLEKILTPVALAGRQNGLTYSLVGPQDRRYSGTLPDRLELPRGRYLATFVRPGYGEKREELSVGAQPLEITADIPGARLEVTSEPSGATVRSGERVLGQTPLRLEDQPTGPLPLTLSAEHFDPLEITADLKAGEAWNRQLKLSPDATSVALQSIDGYWIPTGMLGALSDSAVFISAENRTLVMPGKALWRKAVLEATVEHFDPQAGAVLFKGSTKDWEGTFLMGREGEELLYWFPVNPKQKWRFKRSTEEEYRKVLRSVTGR